MASCGKHECCTHRLPWPAGTSAETRIQVRHSTCHKGESNLDKGNTCLHTRPLGCGRTRETQKQVAAVICQVIMQVLEHFPHCG